MKVLIVNPPAAGGADYNREGRCMQRKTAFASLWTPLTLAYCASALRNEGHEVRLVDCIAERTRPESLQQLAEGFSPVLIVVNTSFPTIESDMAAAEMLHRGCRSAWLAAIGVCATLIGADLLARHPALDFVIAGEPEWALVRLASALETKADLHSVNGLLYRETGKIVTNAPQDMGRNDINELPFPARDLLDNDAYRLPVWGDRFTLVSIGRGCPHPCIYCVANVFYGRKFRPRDARSIVNELEECVNRHKIGHFLFWGESFTLDSANAERICDEIIARKLDIKWSTTSRVDTLSSGLLAKMKQAGCVMLGLGIESFSQEVLDRSAKGITVAQIRNAIQLAREAGIRTMGHFIFGLPGETPETAEETIRLACGSGLDYAQFYCAVPYPGTQLGEMAEREGWVTCRDYGAYEFGVSSMWNETLSSGDVMRLRDLAYRKFYLRPSAIFRLLGEVRSLRSLRSLPQFMQWMKPRRTAGRA